MSTKMIAIGIIAILLVTGIGVGVAASNNDSGDKGIDVVDGVGTKIHFDKPCETAVVFSKYIGEAMILMGGSDKVVGTTSTIKKDTNYSKYYTNAKDLGLKTVGDTVISEIIKLKPDVIFSYKSSDNTALKGTGIPVVEIGASKIVEVVDDITVLGKVMGMEKEADKILDWFKPLYKNFEKEKEKSKTTFLMEAWSAKEQISICKGSSTAGVLMKLAGMNNVYEEAGTTGSYIYPSAGDVIPKNPDVYIVQTYNANWDKEQIDAYYQKIINRPGWSSMKCVEDKKVFFISNDIMGGIRSVIGAMCFMSFAEGDYSSENVVKMVNDYNKIANTSFNPNLIISY